MARTKSPLSYLQYEVTLPEHPKSLEFYSLLGVHKSMALGCLSKCMTFVAMYYPDGNLSKASASTIAMGSWWDGDPELFMKALEASGYIDVDGETRTWHDWDETYGSLIAKREAEALRKKNGRQKRAEKDAEKADVHGLSADNGRTSSDVRGLSKENGAKSRGEKEKSRVEESDRSDPEI